MRLLLLNLNYLRYQFFIKTMQKKIMDFEHPTLMVGCSCLISTINTSNHAELLKLQTHLHHAELQPINTVKIAANLG